jgi:hypothetical protein
MLRRSVPRLKWSIYPRSITTLSPVIAAQVRTLIERRRQFGGAEINVDGINRPIALVAPMRFVDAMHSEQFPVNSAQSVSIVSHVASCSRLNGVQSYDGRLT